MHEPAGTVVVPGSRPARVRGRGGRRGPDPVRWVWDDTTRWYPALLAAGVRVARCTDLRLGHAVLRRSPSVDQRPARGGGQPRGWDALQPVTVVDPGLFPLEDPADRLDPLAEHDRQQAALAASPERGRLALLLAAESSGALVAAEMTHAGLPWRADVHDAAPRRAARSAAVRRGSGRRCWSGWPPSCGRRWTRRTSTRTRPPSCCARCGRAGLPVPDTRSWNLEQVDHPAIAAAAGVQEALPAADRQRLGLAGRRGCGTGGSGRSSCPAASSPAAGRRTAGERCRCPTQVRPAAVADEGWRFVVADVAQLEPRVLAAMAGDTAMAGAGAGAPTCTRASSAAGVVGDPRPRRRSACSARCTAATRGESGRMLPRLTQRVPARHRAGRGGRAGGGARARSSARCSAAARRPPGAAWSDGAADLGEAPGRRGRRRAARTATGSGAPGAGSPATSSSRAPPPSGRCAGWPTCATGCGSWRSGRARTSARTWCSSCTTRWSCTRPEHLADDVARGGAAGRGRGGAPAVRRLPGRLPARRRRRPLVGRRVRGPRGVVE